MVSINLFIAFFAIVALAASWMVLSLLLGEKPQIAGAGGKETNSTPNTVSDRKEEALFTATAIAPREAPPAPKQPRVSTCRDEVVAAAKIIVAQNGVNEFGLKEILDYLIKNGTDYSASTIRTHVVSRCCANAANNNGLYRDFERIDRGRYRLIEK
jgi:hypothetical protein